MEEGVAAAPEEEEAHRALLRCVEVEGVAKEGGGCGGLLGGRFPPAMDQEQRSHYGNGNGGFVWLVYKQKCTTVLFPFFFFFLLPFGNINVRIWNG